MNSAIKMVERGLVPQPLVRWGIRRLLDQRLQEQRDLYDRAPEQAKNRWLEAMRSGPVAPVPDVANEQHYEVPPEFFTRVLGRHLKYSSCYYPEGTENLDTAEAKMLTLTCERATLEDGQDVLELGCGWGSLSLWMAEKYPNSRVLSVSNSSPQRRFIMEQARSRGLLNLEVVTRDMNAFNSERRFDRIVSVEMFEHMRNWEEVLRRVSTWLRDDGRLFIHVFSHRQYAYPFEAKDSSDWMSRYFFTGGMMPSDDLIGRVESDLRVEESWFMNGTHYARTAEHWLENLDRSRKQVMPVLTRTYGEDRASVWFQRWRLFFLACAELFRYSDGEEWGVSHYRLTRAQAAGGRPESSA